MGSAGKNKDADKLADAQAKRKDARCAENHFFHSRMRNSGAGVYIFVDTRGKCLKRGDAEYGISGVAYASPTSCTEHRGTMNNPILCIKKIKNKTTCSGCSGRRGDDVVVREVACLEHCIAL